MSILYKKFFTLNIIFVASLAFSNVFITAKDYSNLFAIQAPVTHEPTTIDQLQKMVKKASINGKKIAIVGAGKSMGGQTIGISSYDYRISLSKISKLVNLNVLKKEVTVQAGMTWKQLQKYIAPYKLSIKAMQSYHDFSVGGSLSVNVHGQALKYTPIISTVIACKLLQPDGNIIMLSRDEKRELFELVIGGYGLFGIIIEVTLSLTDDILLERKSALIDTKDLADYFLKYIKNNPNIEFYSARFSLTQSQLLKKAFVITYQKTDKLAPELFEFNLNPKNNLQKALIYLTAKSTIIKDLRFGLEKWYINQPELISRNNFTNITIESLPDNKINTQYILQEYFIPYKNLNKFVNYLRKVIDAYSINIINVTARHVHQDLESKLSFAQQDCCALVLYINISNNVEEYNKTVEWSRLLIDGAYKCNGSYYLPYQLLGSQKQLELAYPNFKEFIELKKKYDPYQIFVNQLYKKYGKYL